MKFAVSNEFPDTFLQFGGFFHISRDFMWKESGNTEEEDDDNNEKKKKKYGN